jgi:hypothetical protein
MTSADSRSTLKTRPFLASLVAVSVLASQLGVAFAQPKPPAPPAAPQPAPTAPPPAPSGAPSATPNAPATPPPPLADALTGKAKTEYDLGKILYRDGDYAGAMVKFQSAYELSHDGRLLWNVIACEKNLRHYARVLHLLEQYSKETQATATDAEKQEAKDLLEVIKPFVTTVTITVNEPDAVLSVDGEDVGKSPLAAPLTLDMGPRKIKATKPGFKPLERQEKLAGGAALSLDFKLEKEIHEGKLIVDVGPKDAIAIDDKLVATGHWEGVLASGGHTLKVTAPGMRAYQSEVTIADDKTRNVRVALEPIPKGATPWPWIGAGGGVLLGAIIGGYFLFKPKPSDGIPGTITPGKVPIGFSFGGGR